MQIIKITCPPLGTNTYLVIEQNKEEFEEQHRNSQTPHKSALNMTVKGSYSKSSEAIIIDPSYKSTEKVLEQIKKSNIKIKYIINTHGHPDHTWENQKIKELTKAKLLIHKADSHLLKNPEFETPIPFNESVPDKFLENGKTIILGKLKFKIIHTPGHSPGGVCLYEEHEQVLFSGDTLFKGTYGRTDLHHSDSEEMKKSLQKLSQLPSQTKVYPGHGKETTIKEAREWIDRM